MRLTHKLLAAVAPLALTIAPALPSQARADATLASSEEPSSKGAKILLPGDLFPIPTNDKEMRTAPPPTVRDHRTPAPELVGADETRLNLPVGQPLKLAGGKSIILRPRGVLEFINMNGLVARSFEDATIVKDRSGVIWIISGGKRVRAGVPQRTSTSSQGAVRDHRTTQGTVRDHRTSQGEVRDHRTTAPQSLAPSDRRINPLLDQPLNLMLDRGNSLVLRPDGIIEIIGMNGLVARTFQGATLVHEGSGVISIISDDQRVRAGMLQRMLPLSKGGVRDQRTTAPESVGVRGDWKDVKFCVVYVGGRAFIIPCWD